MENMDMRFIALLVVLAVHCECVNIGNGRTYLLKKPNNVKVEYHHFHGWRYIPKDGEKLNDIYRGATSNAKHCLEHCQQTANCLAVNFCNYAHNCHLDGDNGNIAQYTQTSTQSRCILLSAGLGPGENDDDRTKQDDQWTHFYAKITLSDYNVDKK